MSRLRRSLRRRVVVDLGAGGPRSAVGGARQDQRKPCDANTRQDVRAATHRRLGASHPPAASRCPGRATVRLPPQKCRSGWPTSSRPLRRRSRLLEHRRAVKQFVQGFVRTIVYMLGIIFGYLTASIVISFYGSAAADFAGVFGGFGLMIAAPLCWYAAARSPRGDLWTVGYVGAWCLLIGVFLVIGRWERGKSVPAAGSAVAWTAIGALSVVYLVVVPAIVWWRRSGPGDFHGSA